MPQKQRIRLEFPFGGRSDRYGYQKQQPGTTVSSRNVWTDANNRQRGGSRPGLIRAYSQNFGGEIVGLSSVNYIPDASSRIKTKLVAIGSTGAVFTVDDDDSTLAAISGGGITISGDQILTCCERNQKLYIANHSDNQSSSAISYKLQEYDPITNISSTLIATDGLIPRGCPLICLWRDRICLAGGTTNPFGVFMSRQGDPQDWDYSETDESAAVDLGNSDRTGVIGETPTSLTPHADDCLIIGCPTSLWVLQGDPRSGGRLANLSREHGVVDRNAWCTTPDGLFLFLSADGLYGLDAGCAAAGNPRSISREKIPGDLLNIDRRNTSSGKIATLVYDVRHRGVHIWVSDRTSANTDAGNVHWWFDWETKAFFEVQYDRARFDPWTAHARRNFPSSESTVIAGCRDGYLRKYVTTADRDDDGSSDTEKKIASYFTLGPLGDEPEMTSDIRVDEVAFILGSGSSDVTWAIHTGMTPEEALPDNSLVAESGVLVAGRNPTSYPRTRGGCAYIKFSSDESWSFESGTCLLAKMGKVRA